MQTDFQGSSSIQTNAEMNLRSASCKHVNAIVRAITLRFSPVARPEAGRRLTRPVVERVHDVDSAVERSSEFLRPTDEYSPVPSDHSFEHRVTTTTAIDHRYGLLVLPTEVLPPRTPHERRVLLDVC